MSYFDLSDADYEEERNLLMSYFYLSDADYEEEVRCAASGLDGPNSKSYRAMTLGDQADHLRKAAKENPEAAVAATLGADARKAGSIATAPSYEVFVIPGEGWIGPPHLDGLIAEAIRVALDRNYPGVLHVEVRKR